MLSLSVLLPWGSSSHVCTEQISVPKKQTRKRSQTSKSPCTESQYSGLKTLRRAQLWLLPGDCSALDR